MAFIIILNDGNRVTGYRSSSSITVDTPRESNQVFKSEFDVADMYKIYNVDADTLTADDQTATLLNPPEPEVVSEEEAG